MKDIDALHQRIAELETENAALKAQLPPPDQNVFKCPFCRSGYFKKTNRPRTSQMGGGANPTLWQCNNPHCSRYASEIQSQNMEKFNMEMPH